MFARHLQFRVRARSFLSLLQNSKTTMSFQMSDDAYVAPLHTQPSHHTPRPTLATQEADGLGVYGRSRNGAVGLRTRFKQPDADRQERCAFPRNGCHLSSRSLNLITPCCFHHTSLVHEDRSFTPGSRIYSLFLCYRRQRSTGVAGSVG